MLKIKGNTFMNGILISQKITRIEKWDSIKLRSFCAINKESKENLKNGRRYLSVIHWTED
jgi:hypothetical protein